MSTRIHKDPRSPWILRFGFWICIFIAVAVVLRRIYALASPSHSGPPQMEGVDDLFATHRVHTLAHIIPALLLVSISPVIVFRRASRPLWFSRLFYALGAVVGLTAYAMTAYSIGGWIERSAVFVFNTLYLISLARAALFQQRGEGVKARRWELRAIAVLLGIATTRPVMGVLFATASLTHLTPRQFFGIAFWIGFSINTLAFEIWARSVDHFVCERSGFVTGQS